MFNKNVVFSISLYLSGSDIQNVLLVNKDFNKSLDNTFWFERFKSSYSIRDFHKGDKTFECFSERLFKDVSKIEFFGSKTRWIINKVLLLEFGNKHWNIENLLKIQERWISGTLKNETMNSLKNLKCCNKEHYEQQLFYNRLTDYYKECRRMVFKKKYPTHYKSIYNQEDIDKYTKLGTTSSLKLVDIMKRENEKRKIHNEKFYFYVSVILPEKQNRKLEKIKKQEEKEEKKNPLSNDEYRNLTIEEVKNNQQISFLPRPIACKVNKKINKVFSQTLICVEKVLRDLVDEGFLVVNSKERFLKTEKWKYM